MPKVRNKRNRFLLFANCLMVIFSYLLPIRSDTCRIKEKVERIGDVERTKTMTINVSLCSGKTDRVSELRRLGTRVSVNAMSWLLSTFPRIRPGHKDAREWPT